MEKLRICFLCYVYLSNEFNYLVFFDWHWMGIFPSDTLLFDKDAFRADQRWWPMPACVNARMGVVGPPNADEQIQF